MINYHLLLTACKRNPESFLSGHRLLAKRCGYAITIYLNSRTKSYKLSKTIKRH